MKSSAMLKGPNYKGPLIPNPNTPENHATIELVSEECENLYKMKEAIAREHGWPEPGSVSLQEIFFAVQAKVQALHNLGHYQNTTLWPFPMRTKRYYDRMVNFAAAPSTFEDAIPRLICVMPGLYKPNRAHIKGEIRELPDKRLEQEQIDRESAQLRADLKGFLTPFQR
jgi:hypothetical protein